MCLYTLESVVVAAQCLGGVQTVPAQPHFPRYLVIPLGGAVCAGLEIPHAATCPSGFGCGVSSCSCKTSYIGDADSDTACNNAACSYDQGDCTRCPSGKYRSSTSCCGCQAGRYQSSSNHVPATVPCRLATATLPPGVRSSYGPVAAAVGALGGPAAGARASGCAHSRLPPHAALPFVGSF
jgi:hypothetical protein